MTISAKTRISISKESSWGNPGTWRLFPVNPPSMAQNYEQIIDNGLRGVSAKDFGVYRGAGATEATLEGICYPEEIGYLLFGVLGSASSSGGTHTFTLGENPPSFAIEDYPQVQAPGAGAEPQSYVYKGCLLSSLGITFNAGEGAVAFTSAFVGKGSGTQTAETGVVGTPGTPFLGWQGSVDISDKDGSPAAFAQVISAEWTFARETVLQHTLNNTIEPSFGYSGPLEVTCVASIKWHADADISRYRDDTHMHVRMILTSGSKSLLIDAPDCFFNAPPEIDRGDVDAKANWDLRALYVAGSATPVTITLVNDHGSYSL